MKNLNKYLLVLIVAVFGAGCTDDFLDTEPKTTLTDDSFYQTKEHAELAIVGCYDGIQQLYTGGAVFPVLSEVLSDNCFGGGGNNDAQELRVLDEFDLSVSADLVNILDGYWVAYYKAIYRINVLLQKMDQINWEGDEDYRNNIEAQARFLRAYCYFDMVRVWEKVPLVTEPTTGNIPQAEVDDIYTLIAEDLQFAAENASETVQPGRVNKWVAKAYLARVFLFYTGYYGKNDLVGLVTKAQALQGLEDVIATGSYGLIEEFKNLWPAASSAPEGEGLTTTYAGKDNKETVFAIKYNITSDWEGSFDGNHWLVMLGFRSQAFSPYGKGWGACPVNPDLYMAYDDEDERKVASIIDIEGEGLDYDIEDQREYTGYRGKKYIALANPDGTDVSEANGGVSFLISQYQDYVVVRYADVLLMAAELGSASAQSYLDQVRDRAGLASVPATFNNIMKERRLEFALEGIRYWDLLRQGVNVAAEAISEETTVKNGGVPTSKSISATNIIKTRGFQMVPQNQITRSSGVLKQNTGWE